MRAFLILGMSLYAVAPVARGVSDYPWTDVGAVTAMGAALLYLVSRSIPKMNKDNNDAHERNTQRQIEADDKRQQRQIEADAKATETMREVMLHCSQHNKD